MLFNIGQVADRLRQDEKALSAFRSYLEQVPDAGNRAEVEARIAALERAEAERKAAAAPATAPPVAPPTPEQTAVQSQEAQPTDAPAFTQTDEPASTPVTKKWWFWTSLGVVVAGGTALALAVALGGDDGGSEPPYQGTAGSFKGP
jgi:cell division septation protein DedD